MPMQSASAPPQSGGFLDNVLGGLDRFAQDNSNALLVSGLAGLGGEGFGGMARAWAQGSVSDRYDRKEKADREEKERKRKGAFALAQQMGFSKGQALTLADDPETLNRLWLHRQTREPSGFERLTKGLDPEQVQEARLQRLGIAPEKARFEKIGEDEDTGRAIWGFVYPQSGRIVPYDQARNRGAADEIVRQGGGQPLPGAQPGAGAPPDGVRPRPPGVDPKTWRQEEAKRLAKQGQPSEMPAELAGRLALVEEYLSKAPGIEAFIKDGKLTGLWDANKGFLGYGEQGEVYRQVQSGVDGLRRALTGAGMPKEEAEEYASRYLPQRTDNADKLLSKHQQLTNELMRFRDIARQGRGGVIPSASVPQGTTRSGVQWSVGGQ
jgi:hypothetical protein